MGYNSLVGNHKCYLNDLDDGLPLLAPRANRWQRFWRKLQKASLASYHHKSTKYHFKSRLSLIKETRRHISTSRFFVIHPYSVIVVVQEVFMSHIWYVECLRLSYVITFNLAVETLEYLCFKYFMKVALVLNIILNFFTGYTTNDGKEIELSFKKIVLHYMKTYFFFDLMAAVSLNDLKQAQPYLKIMAGIKTLLFSLFLVARFRTFVDYTKTNFELCYRIPDNYHSFAMCILLLLAALHYFTCLMYVVPKLVYLRVDVDQIPGSFMEKYQFSNKTPFEKYVFCFHKIIAHFYRAGIGNSENESIAETVTYIFVLIMSFFINISIIIFLMAAFKKINYANNKYDIMMTTLTSYMKTKNISVRLQDKILTFYQYKFQNKYFDEREIFLGLSDHLKYEIILHSCAHLINSVTVFKNLTKSIIGLIIANLEPEIYLPNELITKYGQVYDCLFLISYGTTATYTAQGIEITHVTDGQIVGTAGYVTGIHKFNNIAIEIVEVFKWNLKDINRAVQICPQLGERLTAQGKLILDYSEHPQRSSRVTRDVPAMLRRGEILDPRHRRYYLD